MWGLSDQLDRSCFKAILFLGKRRVKSKPSSCSMPRFTPVRLQIWRHLKTFSLCYLKSFTIYSQQSFDTIANLSMGFCWRDRLFSSLFDILDFTHSLKRSSRLADYISISNLFFRFFSSYQRRTQTRSITGRNWWNRSLWFVERGMHLANSYIRRRHSGYRKMKELCFRIWITFGVSVCFLVLFDLVCLISAVVRRSPIVFDSRLVSP